MSAASSSNRTPVKIPASGDSTRRIAMWLLCGASLMIILDGTIVTVALPSIQRDLGFSPGNLGWVINAYLIAFGSLLLLAGRLGDLTGRKRIFSCGLAVFTAASLMCGLSTSPALLIAARFAQGIGGAMVSAVSLGMIVTLFPEPLEKAKAIGAFSFVGAAGASVGLVLGGVLTQTLGWHWIFFVNVPIGITAILLAVRALDSDPGVKVRGSADWIGASLATAGLMLGVYAIGGTAQYAWGSSRTLLTAAVALALLTAFVARQATASSPLLPLRIFSVRSVSGANLAQLLVIAAAFGFQVVVTLYMQRVLGYSAAISGLGLLPTAAVIGTVSLGFSARIAARFGPRRDAARRPAAYRRRARVAGLCPGARKLPGAPAWAAGAVRRRRRADLARTGITRHVWCHAKRRRTGLWPVQHHSADRRGARRGSAIHTGRRPYHQPSSGRIR
jgi:EmrB/QacA subfamily drug resistance transporter